MISIKSVIKKGTVFVSMLPLHIKKNFFLRYFCFITLSWKPTTYINKMLGLAAIPSALQFVGFIFMPESPRWLVSKGKIQEARDVLRR